MDRGEGECRVMAGEPFVLDVVVKIGMSRHVDVAVLCRYWGGLTDSKDGEENPVYADDDEHDPMNPCPKSGS